LHRIKIVGIGHDMTAEALLQSELLPSRGQEPVRNIVNGSFSGSR